MIGRRILRWLGALVGLAVLLVVVIIWFIYSGIYNVAADYPDSAPVVWILSTTKDHSVKRHAKAIKAPSLDDPAMIQEGLRNYQEDCVMCHGAPGVPMGEVAKAFNPAPPELTEEAGEWTASELFWITKRGVRMTGMPAWGKIDSDKELWATIAFTRKLSSMTPEEYRAMNSRLTPAEAL